MYFHNNLLLKDITLKDKHKIFFLFKQIQQLLPINYVKHFSHFYFNKLIIDIL
jgi:hypothetical protein